MQRIVHLFFRACEALLVIALVGMVFMVLGNVILRYGFNSGIAISEEMARFFFVWLTFVGAVVTFREHSHMGIESFVQRLSRRGRLICMAVANTIIVGCGAIFFWGTWLQFDINASMAAPVTEISMAWVYGIGLFTGGGIVLIAGERLLRQLTGRITDEEIAQFCGEGHAAAAMREHAQ